MAQFTTQVLLERKQVFALEPEYLELYESLAAPNVFMSPEWVFTWIDTLGRRYELCFVTCRDEAGRLAGVWPLFKHSVPVIGTIMMPVCAHSADVFDPIAAPEALESLVEGVFSLCRKENATIWIPLLSEGFIDSFLRPKPSRKGTLQLLRPRSPRFYIDLKDHPDIDSFSQKAFGAKTRQSLRRKSRKLEEAGGVLSFFEAPSEVTPWIDRVFELDAASWKGKERVSIFSKGEQRLFYRFLFENLSAKGRLRLSVLTIAGEPAACEVGLLSPGRYCMHTTAFEPHFSAHSPGWLLMLGSIERCIAERRPVYDFMQNDQEFKRQLANNSEHLWDWILLPKSFCGLLLFILIQTVYCWTRLRQRADAKKSAQAKDHHEK